MYKLFIDGAFVRSESARSQPLANATESGGNIARASRKDVRDAVLAARRAQPKWWKTAPATRGLVLYRLAEMLEARKAEFAELLTDARQIDAAIDRTLWYAGWCDKYNALLSARNPVGGPHLNFSTAEPAGVVALLAPDDPPLLALVSTLLPPIVAGNSLVAVASEKDARSAIVFAEAVATSDMPAGVVNILTGNRSELAPVLAKHMDVNTIALEPLEEFAQLQAFAAENLKRTRILPKRDPRDWYSGDAQSLNDIAAYCEIKTIWHPAGI
jgi:acyl-CoA reductase-like NAD-dependent aldehyde dehydrogenase